MNATIKSLTAWAVKNQSTVKTPAQHCLYQRIVRLINSMDRAYSNGDKNIIRGDRTDLKDCFMEYGAECYEDIVGMRAVRRPAWVVHPELYR